ncbi:GNAT family N-acetyltransferase [Candidatus Uhrbacteria bacterium]|nr:GNAT family N-acetyltransferase [Candidatus Uhrbacteria bacterium]
MEIRDGVEVIPDVEDFFVGWTKRPTQEVFKNILKNSDVVVAAVDETGTVVGFATALTDHALAAYISLIEVLPEHQGKGIGKAMTDRIIERLGNIYMIDTVCDENLVGFYEKFGMKRGIAMMKRNY